MKNTGWIEGVNFVIGKAIEDTTIGCVTTVLYTKDRVHFCGVTGVVIQAVKTGDSVMCIMKGQYSNGTLMPL